MPEPPDNIQLISGFGALTIEHYIYFSVIFVLLLLAAITTSSESAFFSLNPADKEKLKNEESKSSKIILDLLSKPRELIAILLISINFVNVGVVILSTMILNQIIPPSPENEWSRFVAEVFGITLLILILGEVIPKIYGANNSLKVVRIMAVPINFVRQMPPISWLKSLLVNGTAFIGRMGTKNMKISQEELEYAVAITKEDDVATDEQKLLEGIVKFGKIEAVQIMKPRIEMSALNEKVGFKEVIDFVIECGYSRIPVYGDSTDEVIGILYIKDLLPHLSSAPDFDWLSMLRKPFFIPENKKIDDLLQEFRGMKMHMAVVVDEYGGACGIITLEDILEEIVGEITDEFDDEEVEYTKIDDRTFVFEGRTPLNDFYKVLQIDADVFEADKGEAETLGGFIMETAGRILKNNEYIQHKNFKLIVESSDKRRVKWVRVVIQ